MKKNYKSTNITPKKKTVSGNLLENKGIIVIFIAILAFIFYPPFVRGMFFENEQLPAEIITLLIFCVYWIFKYFRNDRHFIGTSIEYTSFGFVLVYLLSIIVSVSTRLALAEWLKYCMYFAVFFVLTDLVKSFKDKITTLWVIVSSTLALSIIGFDGAAGEHISKVLVKFFDNPLVPRYFTQTVVNNRINSTLQYPNALAAYLMAVFFITLGLLLTSSKLWTKLFAGGSSFILLSTFIFTQSRGALLIFPIVAIIFLVSLPKGSRVQGAAFAFASILPNLLLYKPLSTYISNHSGNKIWAMLLVGVIIAIGLTYAFNYLNRGLERISWKVYAGIIGAVILFGAVVVLVMLNTDTPVELSHINATADGQVSIQKKAIIKPGKDYSLLVNLEAEMKEDKPNAYTVKVGSQSEKEIITSTETSLVSFDGKASSGIEQKQIKFKVPQDSKVLNIYLINTFKGTRVVFHNAKIVDSVTGKTVKNLVLRYKYIPDSIASKFEGISATKSGVERSIFYKDGLKIVGDRWLLGGGGGSWQLLYFAHQSYLYWTTQAHNYFLQVAVECGVVGFLILILLIAAIIIMFIRDFKNDSYELKDRIIQSALFTGILTLFIHSAIDFDMSLSAVSLLLWELIAIFNSRYRKQSREDKLKLNSSIKLKVKEINVKPLYIIIATIIIGIFPIILYSGVQYADSALKARQLSPEAAAEKMKAATTSDPFAPQYKIDYAKFLLEKQNKLQSDMPIVLSQLDKARGQSSYSSDMLAKIGSNYISAGDFAKGIEAFTRSTKLRPFWEGEWQQKASAYNSIMMYYFSTNDKVKAMDNVNKALKLVDEAKEVNKRNMIPFIFNVSTSETLERFQYIKDNLPKLKNIVIDKVVFYSLLNMDINSDGIPDQWSPFYPGNTKIVYSNNSLKVTNTEKQNDCLIQSRVLNFSPNAKYRVEVELAGNALPDSIPFAVTYIDDSNTGLKRNGNIYSDEFSTPEGFKGNGANFLRLYVRDSLDIKSVKIVEK